MKRAIGAVIMTVITWMITIFALAMLTPLFLSLFLIDCCDAYVNGDGKRGWK